MLGDKTAYQEAMRVAHALAWEMKWDQAIGQYRAAVDQFPDDPAARGGLAASCFRIGKLDEALEHYTALLELTPHDETALVRMAEIRERQAEAGELTEAFLRLAEHYLGNGARPKAVQTWARLLELVPQSLESQERLYQAVARAGEKTLAGRIGQSITRLRGEQAERGLNPLATPSATTPGTSSHLRKGEAAPVLDAEMRRKGLAELEDAQESLAAGNGKASVLLFAKAAATFDRAGARADLSEVERTVLSISLQLDSASFRDLLSVDEAARPIVVENMEMSSAHLGAGRLIAATDACLIGICAAPTYLPLHERLAETELEQGSTEAAVARLVSVAELYLLRGELKRASEALHRSAELGHIESMVWERLIGSMRHSQLGDAALEEAMNLAERLLSAGQVESAVRLLRSEEEAWPDRTDVLLRLGQALELARDAAGALDAYARALRIDRRSVNAALRTCVFGSVQGSEDTAAAALGAAVEALAEGRLDRAMVESTFREVEEGGTAGQSRACYGVLLAQCGDWTRALGLLRSAAEGEGLLGVVAKLWLGRHSLREGSLEGAVRHLASVQAFISSNRRASESSGGRWLMTEAQRLWAELCLGRGELEKAEAGLLEVKRLAPEDKGGRAKLAEVQLRRGDVAAAAGELVGLGEIYQHEENWERARVIYEAARQVVPDDEDPKRKLADVLLASGRQLDAVAALDDLANLLVRVGHVGRAVEVLGEMIDLSKQLEPSLALSLRERMALLCPHDADVRQKLIAAYLAAGQSDRALVEASTLSQDMLKLEKLDEAMAALQQVLQIDPWNAEALFGLGQAYEQRGDLNCALDYYRRALSADSSNNEASAKIKSLTRAKED